MSIIKATGTVYTETGKAPAIYSPYPAIAQVVGPPVGGATVLFYELQY